MNGREQVVELGPIRRPSTIVLLIALAAGIVPLSVGLAGCASVLVQSEATPSDTFGLVLGFGSLTGLLLIGWLTWIGVLLGRRTRVNVAVFPTELAIRKTWAGLFTFAERRVPRVVGDSVFTALYSRGGRGSLPTWQLVYGDVRLLSVDAFRSPPELEQAAERLRSALTQIPFAAHPQETRQWQR